MPGVSECPICQRPVAGDDEHFGTWGVFSVPRGLSKFCDAVMHWECYAVWPRRKDFARAYFDFWVANMHHNPHWAEAYHDDRVLVTVNPFIGGGGTVEMVLA